MYPTPALKLCDAPLVLYALLKLGLAAEPRVQTAAQHLVDLIRDNGWPCAVTPDLGKFRGSGRKADPCPYVNLVVLKALSQVPALRDGDACHRDERYGVWGNPNTLSWLLRRLPTTFAAFVQRAVQARSGDRRGGPMNFSSQLTPRICYAVTLQT